MYFCNGNGFKDLQLGLIDGFLFSQVVLDLLSCKTLTELSLTALIAKWRGFENIKENLWIIFKDLVKIYCPEKYCLVCKNSKAFAGWNWRRKHWILNEGSILKSVHISWWILEIAPTSELLYDHTKYTIRHINKLP